jgi:cytochrome b6-f complex iron-sulfur subunit
MAQLSPARPDLVGLTRRRFLNRSITGLLGLGVTGFAGSVLAFMWPRATGSFGSTITLGPEGTVLGAVREAGAPMYVAAGRFYLVPYGDTVQALYQKCTHLGCRVPFCESSQWFECACHASKYNLAGEWKSGPAPRGLDRFPVSVDHGMLTVNTGNLMTGPPHGTDTTGQEPAGPHCVEEGH